MPLYDFQDKKTKKIEEHLVKYSELDQFKKDNPHLEQVFVGNMNVGDPHRLGIIQPPDSFKSLLRGINKKYKGNMQVW